MNNFNNTPNYNPNSLPTLNNGMDQTFYANMDNNMNNTHNLGMNYLSANHPLYTTFSYCIVFSNLPDQPWPSYNLLTQCLDKVRARDAKVYSSLDAIQRYNGVKTGDLILSFTAAAATDGVIWTSAEGVILHQMRYWDRDRRMAGWALVGEYGLAL
ncbi:hypothetical protein Aspvir_001638 [Aspergillus viridinutans]|uniref:Uncharacterized protein n=1 Tax=Aspergillus viridinutans TaxID=75553 RepID=A0A9P3BUB3_ASPVI|nr:uncharacterized protein Aspvir_001638 [Aspergillus viridinutans]GIJ99506.1 hypothetical protein Aspvir_001638 [Aspergillus viridinutans]